MKRFKWTHLFRAKVDARVVSLFFYYYFDVNNEINIKVSINFKRLWHLASILSNSYIKDIKSEWITALFKFN